MKYITRVYSVKARDMVAKLEEESNKAFEEEGLELVSFSIPNPLEIVVVYKKD